VDTLIELKDVTVVSQDYTVLDSVNVAFSKGRSTVIMGPSGCGKSMLLKVSAGIIPPDSGRVLLGGRSLERLPAKHLQAFRRSSGFMFQDGALWANKSVFENLALPLQYHYTKLTAGEISARVNSLLEAMNLSDSPALRPDALSVGERKIVSFLRAVILEPSVLFLDEPTPSIDHQMVARMLQMIRDLRDNGCTIIAVTHDAHLTSMIASDLVVLKAGRVLEAAEMAKVRRSANREVIDILSQVLSEAATYDADILDLLQE
jgi:phospholipid/cholesterol/gamma-HCH transport system ATP-binding protein